MSRNKQHAIVKRGDLWDICKIYPKVADQQDAHGGPINAYTFTSDTRRCRVDYTRGQEQFRGGTVDAVYDVTVTLDDYDLSATGHQLDVTSISTGRTVRYDIVWVEHVRDRGRKTIAYCRVGTQ